MKKKLAAMILTLALAAGVMAPVPAYADGITVEETSMDTATEKSFDTDYTVKWDADKVYWNKVTLDQQGILRIHLNEEDPKSLENYDVAVYTAKGACKGNLLCITEIALPVSAFYNVSFFV